MPIVLLSHNLYAITRLLVNYMKRMVFALWLFFNQFVKHKNIYGNIGECLFVSWWIDNLPNVTHDQNTCTLNVSDDILSNLNIFYLSIYSTITILPNSITSVELIVQLCCFLLLFLFTHNIRQHKIFPFSMVDGKSLLIKEIMNSIFFFFLLCICVYCIRKK